MGPHHIAAIAKAKAGGLKPKAIIAVDLFGQAADYAALEPIARREGLKLLVDTAQGFGATLNAKQTAAFGDAAALLSSAQERPYVAVVVDETQDFGPQALKLIRALVSPGTNDLFFVGDGHQRIYSRHRASMGKCGINILGRSKKLYLNYRTTEEIRRAAVALLEGQALLKQYSDKNIRNAKVKHLSDVTSIAVEIGRAHV